MSQSVSCSNSIVLLEVKCVMVTMAVTAALLVGVLLKLLVIL